MEILILTRRQRNYTRLCTFLKRSHEVSIAQKEPNAWQPHWVFR